MDSKFGIGIETPDIAHTGGAALESIRLPISEVATTRSDDPLRRTDLETEALTSGHTFRSSDAVAHLGCYSTVRPVLGVILENMPSDPAKSTFVILLLGLSSVVPGAPEQSSWERIGELRLGRAHAAWISPESLIRDLRSQDTAVRLKALQLVGIDASRDFIADAVPDEIELRYASLEGAHSKQAIVLVEASSYAYAALAVPSANAWERIAVLECWCKYEGSTLPDDFVRVEYTHHFTPDLVLRASGGGAGVYEQTEARFALKGGELRKALALVSRRRDCPVGTNKCLYEHRWFTNDQLAEAKARFDSELNLDWNFADAHGFRSITCTTYSWDAASFTYIRSGPAHPCEYEPPK